MTSKTNTLTQERLQELLHYDPLTGIFRWLLYRNSNAKIGDIAGSPHTKGHLRISIDGKQYLSHRLAWFYMTGQWPASMIDHENTDGSDNRWLNLREATHAQNCMNAQKRSDNSSGFKGVSFSRERGKFVAQINRAGKRTHVGIFDTAEEAAKAYDNAARLHHGEFARVNFP